MNAAGVPCEDTMCDGRCVDKTQNVNHCGDCGNICPIQGVCSDSECKTSDGDLCPSYVVCLGGEECAAIGNSCTHGGYAEWPLPGTPKASRSYSYFSGSQTVVDNITGLEWQRLYSLTNLTWYGAKDYCDSLNLDGKSDWRLPSTMELMTLIDYSRSGVPIDTSAFPLTSGMFWTSSPGAAHYPNGYWLVDFSYSGLSAPADSSLDFACLPNNVCAGFSARCVR